MEIIASHANPDFDSCASMVAAARIYTEARPVFLGSQNRNVREFFALHGGMVDFMEVSLLDKEAVNRLIVVDTRVADRLASWRTSPASPESRSSATTTILRRRTTWSARATSRARWGPPRPSWSACSGSAPWPFPSSRPPSRARHTRGHGFAHVPDDDAGGRGGAGWLMDQGAAVPVLERFLTRALSEDQALLYRQLEETAGSRGSTEWISSWLRRR